MTAEAGNPVDDLLRKAREVEETSPAEALGLYTEALRADKTCLAAHNALERLDSPEAYGRWMRVDCTIDTRDDIFRFFAAHPWASNPIREYLSDGWRTLAELMLLLERSGRPLAGLASILEFASGFGRLTRHLSRAAPGRLTCADVLPGSAQFVQEHFGVKAFESSRIPEDIRWPQRYDLVFVLSLFTHLPLEAWPRWIARLAGAVEPGGLLVFSIHSPDYALEDGVTFDAEGGRFFASSESHALDAGDYGTTFATWERVLREVQRALPGTRAEIRERAFWHGQDAVVVRPGP